jgi:hypothetical protein
MEKNREYTFDPKLQKIVSCIAVQSLGVPPDHTHLHSARYLHKAVPLK